MSLGEDGKGSKSRPIQDRDTYEANWDSINWNSRNDDKEARLRDLYAGALPDGPEDGASPVQETDPTSAGPRA
jgi:hypothetical protein